jgi:septal ring factor EnvC (AmiA/AmiB activator)
MKKFFTMALTMVLLFSLFSPVAYASDNDLQSVIEDVTKTNAKIDELISDAIVEADEQIAKYTEAIEVLENEKVSASEKEQDKLDTKIEKLEEQLDDKIEKIISDLIDDTNKLAEAAIERAAKKGYTVTCELVEVEIGGQTVYVDPLRVGAY